ncbi:unnamed protein product [Amoebophrya sp. A120]|nr:unnamed protein product [Amoebophrya sp. A120]|eukprot:GSA120T00000951001.1
MESQATPSWGLYKYREQPSYLTTKSVAETFLQSMPSNPADVTNAKKNNPAGYSKYISNKFPHNDLGCQWDAQATLGTKNMLRHITNVNDPRARPSAPALMKTTKLTDLRDVGHYKAGQYIPDAKEGKGMVPGNPNHHVVARETMVGEPIKEMLIYPRDERAGTEPTTQLKPATGWVPPTVSQDYENMSPALKYGSVRIEIDKIEKLVMRKLSGTESLYWGAGK